MHCSVDCTLPQKCLLSSYIINQLWQNIWDGSNMKMTSITRTTKQKTEQQSTSCTDAGRTHWSSHKASNGDADDDDDDNVKLADTSSTTGQRRSVNESGTYSLSDVEIVPDRQTIHDRSCDPLPTDELLFEWAGGGRGEAPSSRVERAAHGDEYGECAGGGGVSIVMTEGDELSRDSAAYNWGNGSHESASDSIAELVL